MTSPTGGEHISRYRALGEFDNLIREANKAKRALRELREEEAKLNAQSMAEDKKVAASKAERARVEESSAKAAHKATTDLNKDNSAGKAGEDAGTSYSKGVGKGIEKGSQSSENKRFVDAATKALQGAFAKAGNDAGVSYSKGLSSGIDKESKNGVNPDFAANAVKALKTALSKAGDDSGREFLINVKERFKRDSENVLQSSGFEYSLREFATRAGRNGEDTGNRYVQGFATKIKALNDILPLLGQDKLDLDVDITDAKQSMAALEFELKRLSHITAEPRVRIDATRALENLKAIQRLFKDEVAEDVIKESRRIQDELKAIGELPSGKAFKFWSLTALSDMARVFNEADRGSSVFEKLRKAIAASGGGGGGNYFKTVISGFDDFSEASSNLLQRLGRVSGELYRMPGLIGVLVSAIPALVAGVGAIGGGALGAASALGSLTGFVAAGPGLFAAFTTAIFALKVGVGGLGDIFKDAAKAQAEQAEEQEKMRLGTDKALTATQKYKLALGQLSENTQKVIGTLVELQKPLNIIKEDVGEEFFKPLANDTGLFNDALKIMSNLLKPAAGALGDLADKALKMLTSGPWTRDFGIISKNNVTYIENLGDAGLSLINVFRNIAVAAGPFTTWVTKALKEGAQSFSDWSAEARSNGSIQAFLGETQETAESLWQTFKNLGNIINSFFKATVDEGQSYLRTLEDITAHWADVAKAQESANSPLRRWMTEIRPIFSSLSKLIADLARGIGGLASNQNNITNMVALLDSLRTKVLPPILEILQHLNDSGIAVSVVDALGSLLDAISKFLDSGATSALTVFVTVLSNFAKLVFGFAGLPVISSFLGGLASALAALAAVSVVARFTGLFKLWDFFTWMVRNKGNLSGAFADAARGAAGLTQVGGQQALPAKIPSPVAKVGGIGSEVIIANEAKAIASLASEAERAAPKVGVFNRALSGISTAGSVAKGALGGITSFLGGPWGVALIAATTLIGVVIDKLGDQKKEAQDTKDAFIALKNAYGDLSQGNTENVENLSATNEKFKEISGTAKDLGLSLSDVSGALNNNGQDLTRVNTQLDAQIATYERLRIAAVDAGGPTAAIPYKQLKDKAIDFKNSINDVAEAQEKTNDITSDATSRTRTYEDRLGGLTQAQVDNAVQVGALDDKIRILSKTLDVMASATSSNEDRSRALGDIIGYSTDKTVQDNEAKEDYSNTLLNLTETVKGNKDAVGKHGNALDINTRAGLRNRDALQEAAKATRDLFLQDIASGTPMDKALKRHNDRITALREEAKRLKLSKDETNKLIEAYGDVPDDVKTSLKTEGFQKVFQDLQRLNYMQEALKKGLSPDQAEKEYQKNRGNSVYNGGNRSPSGTVGDGPGFATGGPVWGAGSKTSDSIRAWLSNGEFVQPTDAVEHYGLPVMEALRKRTLDKSVIAEALPDSNRATFASGGQAHSDGCVSCQSGGHKFANGGTVNAPFPVSAKDTLVDKNWLNQFAGGLGQGSGSGGVAWMMSALRKQFPGLPLISGFRRNSTTLSGNRSYHSLGRAVDLPPRRDVAQWIRSNYGAKTKELITPYNDLNLWNGKPHRYTGAIWNQHNFAGGNAHDHWAYRNGGLVDIMNSMGLDNLAPQKQAPLPTTPRSLSPAASSVINNSTDNARTFGDVIINNPMPERAGDSIRDSLYRTQLLL